MAAGLSVRHLRPGPTVFSSCLLHSHQLSWLWSVCLPSPFRGSYSLCLGSALIANILSSGSWPGPDLGRIRRHILAELCKDCALPQNFFVAQLPRSSMRPVATSSSSFLVRKASNLSPSLSLFLSSLVSFVAPFFKHIVQVGYSFCAFLATLCPRDFLCIHQSVKHSEVRRDLCPLSFRFRMYQGVYETLSPAASRGLLPPGFR